MSTKKYTCIQILCIFGMLLFAFIDLYLYKNGYFEEKKLTLMYQENNNIDYKVYLKKNDFFESKYLEKDKTYITSLIDYINVDFDYNIKFDHLIKGNYKYRIYVTVESNKSNGEANYWTKDYNLTDEKSVNVDHVGEYTIHETIKIDYNKYNNILNSFKKTLGLGSASGLLKIYMVVDSDIVGNEVQTPINSKLLLQFPLSELTIEATAEVETPNNTKSVTKSIDTEKLQLMKTIGIIYIFAIVVCLLLLIYITKVKRDVNKYENDLKKILSTYDSIIVNVKRLPDLKKYEVIDVQTFEELLDAHSEVRMPINFYKDVRRSYFILLNENTAWKYTMKKRRTERM